MAYLLLLVVLFSGFPAILFGIICPQKSFFAVAQREVSTELDGAVFLVSFQDGIMKQEVKLTSELAGSRPSYVAVDSHRVLSTNAIAPGELKQTRFTGRAPFVESTTVASKASRSTHVSVVGDVVVVANFEGSVSTFLSTKSGLQVADEYQIPPSLASKGRNESLSGIFAGPHPHMAFPYKKGILVPDLGSDLLWYFKVDKNSGKLSKLSKTPLTIGDGPRHVVVHRQSETIYVVNQVSVTIVALREGRCGTDRICANDRRSLLDIEDVGEISAAAIRLSGDGRFLYVSVRMAEGVLGRIVVFSLNSRTGDIIEKIGEWSSCGIHPRDFDIVDAVMYNGTCTSFLAVANRDSNNVVLLERNEVSGALSADCNAISTSITGPISVVNYDG